MIMDRIPYGLLIASAGAAAAAVAVAAAVSRHQRSAAAAAANIKHGRDACWSTPSDCSDASDSDRVWPLRPIGDSDRDWPEPLLHHIKNNDEWFYPDKAPRYAILPTDNVHWAPHYKPLTPPKFRTWVEAPAFPKPIYFPHPIGTLGDNGGDARSAAPTPPPDKADNNNNEDARPSPSSPSPSSSSAHSFDTGYMTPTSNTGSPAHSG
jgi:hypothetical protein